MAAKLCEVSCDICPIKGSAAWGGPAAVSTTVSLARESWNANRDPETVRHYAEAAVRAATELAEPRMMVAEVAAAATIHLEGRCPIVN